MLELLETHSQIGAIADIERQLGNNKGVSSGEISPLQGILYRNNDILVKVNIPIDSWLWHVHDNNRYAISDFTRNFLLIKRKVFSKVRWNENLFFSGEHLDFMLSLRSAGWLLAFTPESIHDHDDTNLEKTTYKKLYRKDLKHKEFLDKYKIRKVINKNTSHGMIKRFLSQI